MHVVPKQTERGVLAQQKTAEAHQWFDAIRNDIALSAEGKRRALAREWSTRAPAIAALGEQETKAAAARRESLHRKLFGSFGFQTGSDVISQRDAADRASRITDADEAARLLTAAKRNGDTGLAKAIAQHSFHEQWIPVLEQWAGGNERVEDELTELYTLTDTEADAGTTSGLAALIGHEMVFSLEKPVEISNMPSEDIAALAQQATVPTAGGPLSLEGLFAS